MKDLTINGPKYKIGDKLFVFHQEKGFPILKEGTIARIRLYDMYFDTNESLENSTYLYAYSFHEILNKENNNAYINFRENTVFKTAEEAIAAIRVEKAESAIVEETRTSDGTDGLPAGKKFKIKVREKD